MWVIDLIEAMLDQIGKASKERMRLRDARSKAVNADSVNGRSRLAVAVPVPSKRGQKTGDNKPTRRQDEVG
ncbi:MAG TPA: hypothetical protein VGM94_05540 [Galbitalea sp.]|jgi:hypothetical protein